MENYRKFVLIIKNILEEYSDENHYLTQQDIIDIIERDQGYKVDRRSVGRAINELIDLDYDIDHKPRKGYALLSRLFDSSEAEYLIHAIYSCKAISTSTANELVRKLESVFSKYEKRKFSHIYNFGDYSRTENKQVLYNISVIEEAINNNNNVTFQYYEYDVDLNAVPKRDGYFYRFCPSFIFSLNSSYWVCGFYDTHLDHPSLLRLNKIQNISIIDDSKRVDVKDVIKDFDIKEFINGHIYPYTDKVITGVIEFSELRMIDTIIGWFGKKNVSIKKIEDNKYIAEIRNSKNCLSIWIKSYADKVKVLEPQSLKDDMKTFANSVLEKYK